MANEFFDLVDEVAHVSTDAGAALVTDATVEETLAASDYQIQHTDGTVDEAAAAADDQDAELDPRNLYVGVTEVAAASDEYVGERTRRWTDDFGTQVLNREGTNPTSFERSAADLEAGVLMDINVELIIDTWDAYATQLRNLPFLAWAYDVDMWEDGWSEWTRRQWVDVQHTFKPVRGTIGAIATALQFAGLDFVGFPGYELKQYMTPPQAFYFSPGLTVEEHNEWLRLMPEIRIYLGSEKGEVGADWFWDDGFYDAEDYVAYDNGWELYGRKAILRQRGFSDVNLVVKQRETITELYQTIDWEEIRVPGTSVTGWFWGDDFFEPAPLTVSDTTDTTDNFFSSEEVAPRLFNVTLDRSFDRYSTELHLSAVQPSLKPIDVTYERDSDIGTVGDLFFWNDGFWSDDSVGIFEEDNAALMLADRLYLYDPNIATPMSVGLSFWDVDRFGFPRHTMELLVDLHTEAAASDSFWEASSFWDDFFWEETDLEHIDRACRAIVAAKSLRDKALVQFDPWRPIRASDKLTEETTANDWVPNNL